MQKNISRLLLLGMAVLMLGACGSPSAPASEETLSGTNGNASAEMTTTTLPEQVVDSGDGALGDRAAYVGKKLKDYLAVKDGSPRYFSVNTYYSTLDELIESTAGYLYQDEVIVVYFGDKMIPYPGEEVVVIPMYFDYALAEGPFEELIEVIDNSKIEAIVELPYDPASLVNNYASVEEVETASYFVVGKRLEDLIDISAYNAALSLSSEAELPEAVLYNALRFSVFDNTPDRGLWNYAHAEGVIGRTSKESIEGATGTVMITQTDMVYTYDLIYRQSYEGNDYCTAEDLGNYVVIANDLSKAEVEMMVNSDDTLKPEFEYLLKALSNSYKDEPFTVVGEWKFEQTGSSVTFKEDGTYESYLGDGFVYEYMEGSSVVAIDITGFGYGGMGIQDFIIVEEYGTYKLVCNDIVLDLVE